MRASPCQELVSVDPKLLICLGVFITILTFTSVSPRIVHRNQISLSREDCGWIYDFENKRARNFSEGVQDSILEHIFKHIGTENRFFVEFGFGYTGNISREVYETMGLNTANLRNFGWRGVYFDAVLESEEFNVHKATLTSENIVSHFAAAGVPRDVDYVSIDVDSIDLWLLRSIIGPDSSYRPRVISIEYNANYASDMMISMANEWHAWTGRSVYGSSAAAINYIATMNGYTAVHIMDAYLDMFLIRDDLLQACKKPSFNEVAAGKIPHAVHMPCLEEDIKRLVDVISIIAYPNDREYAHQNARSAVGRLAANFQINMCNNEAHR